MRPLGSVSKQYAQVGDLTLPTGVPAFTKQTSRPHVDCGQRAVGRLQEQRSKTKQNKTEQQQQQKQKHRLQLCNSKKINASENY